MLIEYAAGPEGENNKCLKHFSQNNVEFHFGSKELGYPI